jgi:hypothetical protein
LEPTPALPSFADHHTMWATHLARGATVFDFVALQKQMWCGVEQPILDYAYLTDPRSTKGVRDYGRSIATVSYGQRFGVTEQGYMGLIPPGAEVGDLLCVIWGAETPVLLRQRSSDRDGDGANDPVYHLVGACYIHGMMAGEILEMKGLKSEMVQLV